MDPNIWQAYDKTWKARNVPTPRAAIWATGRLWLNGLAWRSMGSPVWVRLFYSEERQQIALVPTNAPMPGAVKFAGRPGNWGASCAITGFCNRFDIPTDRSFAFEPDPPRPDHVLILDLTTAEIISRSRGIR